MRADDKKTGLIVVALLLASLLMALPIQLAKAQTATVSVSPQTSTAPVGKTVTVAIQISNVQNLYGLDVTLSYNSAVLRLTNSKPDLGSSSIPGGVLYGDPVSMNIAPGGVYYNTSLSTSSDYEIFATSENDTAGVGPFSGSGTIVTLTFTVLSSGQSPLTLNVQLASYPQGPGDVSEPISATLVNGNFATPSSSTSPSPSQGSSPSHSSPPSSSSPSPSSSSSSPSTTSPSLLKGAALPVLVAAVAVIVVIAVTLSLVLSRKRTKTPSN
ncbi:MAG TPA: cohesin domain-containing protein [Candidatus Limnocylindrales bacterium]|nr:cohesin domain-containing protein [Candidatus Limnocylindrales bacterium]